MGSLKNFTGDEGGGRVFIFLFTAQKLESRLDRSSLVDCAYHGAWEEASETRDRTYRPVLTDDMWTMICSLIYNVSYAVIMISSSSMAVGRVLRSP
jgi:hypothetical protein